MKTAENFLSSIHLLSPGSNTRVAVERLDSHFGTRTHLVEDSLLLPTHIQKSMALQGFRAGAKGVFDISTNEVYLIASNLADAKDAVMAYRHEVMGHWGVRSSLGDDRDVVFQEIFDSYRSDPRLEDIAQRYHIDLVFPENQLLAAEELVAHLSETSDKPSLKQQVMLKAKEAYAAVTGSVISYNDRDITVLLERGRQYISSRTSPGLTDTPELRSPAELNPKMATLSAALKEFSGSALNEFDGWVVQREGGNLNNVGSIYDNKYLVLRELESFLGSKGLKIEETGELLAASVPENLADYVGPLPVRVFVGSPSPLNADKVFVVPADTENALLVETGASNLVPESQSGQVALLNSAAMTVVSDRPAADLRFMYVGESGAERLDRLDTFAKATAMAMENRPAGEIWMQTGWFEGPDGAWRFEISDREAVTSLDADSELLYLRKALSGLPEQFTNGLISEVDLARKTDFYSNAIDRAESQFKDAIPGTLSEFLSHPTLFEAYPELTDIQVVIDPAAPYPQVTTNTDRAPRIIMPSALMSDPDGFRVALIHETQHLIQRIEGFSRGLSPFLSTQHKAWDVELNELLENDDDVLMYLNLGAEMNRVQSVVNRDQTAEDITMLAEVSPSVQRMLELIERMKLSSDPEAYSKAYGEIEAHEAGDRIAMTEAQRRRIAPYSMAIPPEHEVIVHRFEDIPEAMFMGVRASNSAAGQLSSAHDLELAGAEPEAILSQTGWFRGVDEMWRFEIDDSKASINSDAMSILEPSWHKLDVPRISSISYRANPEKGFDVMLVPADATVVKDIVSLRGVSRSFLMMSLPKDVASSIMTGKGSDDYFDFESDDPKPDGKRLEVDFEYDVPNFLPLDKLLNHETLFEQYPQLKEWDVSVQPETEQFKGSTAVCDLQRRTITLFPGSARQMVPVLLHEIQHAVQSIEGFAMGASPNSTEVAARLKTPTYHSAVLRALESASFKKGTPDQWMAHLRKTPGVKSTEIQWLGVKDFMAEFDGSVELADIREHVLRHSLQIDEVLLAPASAQANTLRTALGKWESGFISHAISQGAIEWKISEDLRGARAKIGWQLSQGYENPPAANEWEQLRKFAPESGHPLALENLDRQLVAIADAEAQHYKELGQEASYGDKRLTGGKDYRELLLKAAPTAMSERPGTDFDTAHWPGHSNVLAHARFQTVEDKNGSKILLVEEIQSDWFTEGREFDGLAEQYFEEYEQASINLNQICADINGAEEKLDLLKARMKVIDSEPEMIALLEGDVSDLGASPKAHALKAEYEQLVDEAFTLVPKIDHLNHLASQSESLLDRARRSAQMMHKSFPMGKEWYGVVAKRLLQYASSNGFDVMAWSPASIQTERYASGERQRLDWLEYEKTEDGAYQLTGDVDGEEVINQLVSEEHLENFLSKPIATQIKAGSSGTLSGPDLTFDSKGFEQFYNAMLPKVMSKYIKPWGEAVRFGGIDADLSSAIGTQFPQIRISDQMRADLSHESVPVHNAPSADRMNAYWRSAGEVEARATENTYRNPDRRNIFPLRRYDVEPSLQIVTWQADLALRIGSNAIGADVASMREAAKLFAEDVLGVPGAAEAIYLAATGKSNTPEAQAIRSQCASLGAKVNQKLQKETGWSFGQTGNLSFNLGIPDCRANRCIDEIIADNVRTLVESVKSGATPVTDISQRYNEVTREPVPIKALIGDHPVLTAYPMLQDVTVKQERMRSGTQWNPATGQITVPPHLSRLEVGAYLAKGLTKAVNDIERIAAPALQKELYRSPDATDLLRSKSITRVVEQCHGYKSVPHEMVTPCPDWLIPEDAQQLEGMALADASAWAQSVALNANGPWLKSGAWIKASSPNAANEHAGAEAKPKPQEMSRGIAL